MQKTSCAAESPGFVMAVRAEVTMGAIATQREGEMEITSACVPSKLAKCMYMYTTYGV